MYPFRRAVFLVVGLANLPLAWGADVLESPNVLAPTKPDWTITLGAEGRLEPSFEGAKRDVLRPYPLLDVRRSGTPERFHAPRDGWGFTVFEQGGFQAGPIGQLKFSRRERDDPALRGLGDVPWTAELGVFGEYWWGPWFRLHAEFRRGIGGHSGIVSEVMADVVAPVASLPLIL